MSSTALFYLSEASFACFACFAGKFRTEDVLMNKNNQYAVILVYSTSHALRAEKLLDRAGIGTKLIPVPRHLSSDCGSCLRILRDDKDRAAQILETGTVEIAGMYEI